MYFVATLHEDKLTLPFCCSGAGLKSDLWSSGLDWRESVQTFSKRNTKVVVTVMQSRQDLTGKNVVVSSRTTRTFVCGVLKLRSLNYIIMFTYMSHRNFIELVIDEV